MYHIMLTLLIVICTTSTIVCNEVASNQKSENRIDSPVNKTARQIMRELNENSFSLRNENWNCWSQYEFLSGTLNHHANPIPFFRRTSAFTITTSTTHAQNSIVQEATTWQDLTMFSAKKLDEPYVATKLCRAKTEIGHTQFYNLLASSSDDITEIARRQAIIKTLLANASLRKELNTLLRNCADAENLLLSFFSYEDGLLKSIEWEYLFEDPILKHINNNSVAVCAKYGYDLLNHLNNIASDGQSIIALATFILSTCIPNMTLPSDHTTITANATVYFQHNILRKLLWNHGPTLVKALLSAIAIYFSATYLNRSVENQLNRWFLEDILHFKMVQVAVFFQTMKDSLQILQQTPELFSLLPELGALQNLFVKKNEANNTLNTFLDLIQDDTFAQDSSGMLANRGKVVIAYASMHKLKDSLLPSLQALGLLDAYCGIADLVEENPSKFCFAQLEKSNTPHLYLEDFINPLISLEKAIPNTIELGKNAPSRNCIITGPNAGGKSTLIKAIGINVLMAQSLGVAAARSCSLTPFNFVATYLNITDDINSGNSLFKAEVLRTQELISMMEKLSQEEHGLLIFDEVFNGTTPKEGSAAAFAVAEHLGSIKNGITIVATHFEQLTSLEKLAPCSYKNYKVSVKINTDGSLNYPFKIEAGISSQHIALDILRSEGYTGAIVTRTAELLAQG